VPTLHQFSLPDVGEGLTEAEVVHWRVAVGDTVAVNDPVVEVETAKSVVELPSPFAGVVAGLLVDEGLTVDVGTPLISVEVRDEGDGAGDGADQGADHGADHGAAPAETAARTYEGAADQAAHAPTAEPSGTAPSAQATLEVSEPDAEEGRTAVLVGYGPRSGAPARRRRRTGAPAAGAGGAPTPPTPPTPAAPAAPPHPGVAERVLATPPVRALARALGVDLSSVRGTGRGGVVTREDVQAHRSAARSAQAPPSSRQADAARETRVPVRGVRKATAQQMVSSAFTAPHATAFVTVDVTRTMKLLDRLRADREFRDVHVSPLLVVSRAVCLAVARNPGINATWDEAAQEIVLKHYVNLGIAVATPRGLMVPSVKDAERLSLRDLALALTSLVRTARDGRSTPADLSGSTISITNIGVFGVDSGTPILNPGEAAILCVGAVRQRPWVHKGKVRPRWVAELSVSFDHRLVDGDLGSRFLADVAAVLERPDTALRWA
jgi:2-oxoisovalerate dehydrogenase E2 component (dihydrolipoyl transacylase)